jgi:hypothetical protein
MFARAARGDEGGVARGETASSTRLALVDSQLRALLDIAPFSVFVVDVQASGQPIVYANNRFVEQTGYSRCAVQYRQSGLKVLHGPETDDEIVDTMCRCVQRGQSWSGKLLTYLADGTKASSHVLAHPVVNVHTGRVTHYTAIHLFTGPCDAPEEVTRRAVEALGEVEPGELSFHAYLCEMERQKKAMATRQLHQHNVSGGAYGPYTSCLLSA